MTAKNVDELVDAARKDKPAPIEKIKDDELVEELQKRGHRVLLEPQEGSERRTRIPDVTDKDRFKFAVASDWHLGSRYQQLTHLKSFLREAKKRKVDFILCPGDVFDGTHKMHRDMIYEQFVHGADAMVDYVASVLPEPTVPTYLISGNHDWSYYSDAGHNVVKRLCAERDGYIHAGDLGTELHLGPLFLYVWHPDGGVAYARSYRMQRWINDRPPEHRPHVLLGGHFHVGNYLSRYSGVEGFQCPAFQAQTPYLKRKGLTPEIGGIVLEITLDDDGKLRRLRHEWIKYPDWLSDDY